MAEILNYKCPCCCGSIAFDSGSQKMKCPYCDTEFEMDTLRQFGDENLEEDRDPQWDADEVDHTEQELEDEGGTLVSYTCDSCGGEIVADSTMAASSCPYCGNPVIVKKKLSGVLRPDLVIPFKLDKDAAKQKLSSHLKGKFLLPSLFRSENRLKEIRGIYVPFWLYDCEADAQLRCRATRVHTRTTQDYVYTQTDHYLVSRGGEIGFCQVPADGSAKMDDALMQSLEPFDYSEAVDFQTAYLAGYLADRYDQTAKDCAPQANQRVRKSTVDAFMGTIHGYLTCVPEHTDIRLRQGKITYALLPVWILNTVYKDKRYTFAMNGQTGKFVGDLPTDRRKAAVTASGIFAAVFLAAFLLTMLF